MAPPTSRGQVIIELILAISFCFLLAYFGHQQTQRGWAEVRENRFGNVTKGKKYYDTKGR